jgi:hypothetical protein
LARELAGPSASPESQRLAREAAAAHIDVDRVQRIRHRLMVPKNTPSPFPIWRATSPSWNATNADRYRGENGHCENSLRNNVSQRESPMWKRATKSIGTGDRNILAEQTQNSQCFQRQSDSSVEETTFFDICIKRQSARLHEQPSTEQRNWIRYSIRRLRESLIARQTKTADKPATSDVSRDLALSFLLTSDDNEPF